MRRLLLAALALLVAAVAAWWVLRPAPDADAPRAAIRPDKDRGEDGLPGAYEALALFATARAYPEPDVPAAGLTRAFAQQRAMAARQAPGGPPWQPIGPHNVGGRTLAVALNPQRPRTIWQGSASGGLWRSYSGGEGPAAWERVPTGFPALSISALAFAPGDSTVLYAGTGEVYRYLDVHRGNPARPTRGFYGIGVLKSEDGGETWALSLDWSEQQDRGVHMLRVDPNDASTVWAATTEGAWVTRDAGATWAQALGVVMASDVWVQRGDPDVVVVACGNQRSEGQGLYRTTDGGQTWTRISSGFPGNFIGKVMLDGHPHEDQTLFASVGNGVNGEGGTWLLRSDNAGLTWSTVTTANYARYQGWFSHFVAVNPHNPQRVWLGGVDQWLSGQGGPNPAPISSGGWLYNPPVGGPYEGPSPDYMHPDLHAFAFHPTQDTIYIGGDGGLFASYDQGQTFVGLNGGYQTGQLYPGIAVSHRDSTLAMGGLQDNGTVVYSGTVRYQRPVGGDGGYSAIDPANDDRRFLSYQYLNLYRTLTGGRPNGQGWEYVGPPPGRAAFIAPYVLAPSAPDFVYAATDRVYLSLDDASSWVPVSPVLDGNSVLSLAVSPADPAVVWAGTAPDYRRPVTIPARAAVHVTLDGQSWADVTGALPDRYPMDIAPHPADPLTAYVVFGGFGSGHVFKTTDGGTSWADVTGGLPDVHTSSALVLPDGETVLVGNDLGVFVSHDGGGSWTAWGEGLPEAIIAMDLVYSPADRSVLLGSHGNGFWKRPLGALVAAEPEAPASRFALAPVAPNPVRGEATLRFTLEEAGPVRVAVYNVAGQHVATLADRDFAAGEHALRWAAAGLASGTYVVRLEAGGRAASRRATVVR